MVVRTILPYSKVVKKPGPKAMPVHLISLGDHIRKRRLETNMTQRDVANIIGVSEDAVTYWENNRSRPQIRHYPAVAAFLGYDPMGDDAATARGQIRLVRNRLGWSYGKMGDALGVDGTTVREWYIKDCVPNEGQKSQLAELARQCLSS